MDLPIIAHLIFPSLALRLTFTRVTLQLRDPYYCQGSQIPATGAKNDPIITQKWYMVIVEICNILGRLLLILDPLLT